MISEKYMASMSDMRGSRKALRNGLMSCFILAAAGLVTLLIFAWVCDASWAGVPRETIQDSAKPEGSDAYREASSPGAGKGGSIRGRMADIVSGSTVFCLDLYGRLKANEGNIFISPYSISAALAMVYAGARGSTMEEMALALHFPKEQASFHSTFSQVLGEIRKAGSDGVKIRTADALWVQQGYGYRKDYHGLLARYYGSSLFEVDYSHGSEKARKRINAWVSKETDRKITDFLSQGMVGPQTVMVVADAIYFSGQWKYRFDKKNTQDGTFYTCEGKGVSTPMMHQVESFRRVAVPGVNLIELPYGEGRTSMIILLPEQRQGIHDLEKRLTPQNLTAWMDSLMNSRASEVNLTVPRYALTSKCELSKVLAAMGMPRAFSSGADFSGITRERDLSISAVVHKCRVEVNEEGTVAAGATGVIMMKSVRFRDEFNADHPFIFLIRDNATGMILFMGRLANPGA